MSIIVVSAGKHAYLDPCLSSVKIQTYPNIETIVIDNSCESSDSSYGVSLNQGINSAKGNFILCLNDDVMLKEDFVAQALESFSVDERIGMVSGKILRMDKKTIDSTGLFLTIFRTALERGYGRPDKGQFEKPGYIFGVCGAVAFYRKSMLEQIKKNGEYFDAGFSYFYEDLDVAWRAQNLGWQGYYNPSAIAYHVRGASLRQPQGIDQNFARNYLSDELLWSLIKNRYLTILKNESFFSILLHLPFILLYDIFVWPHFIFQMLRGSISKASS